MPEEQPLPITVIVIDDDQFVRRAIVDYLRIASDIKIMGTFPKAEAAIEFVRRNRVDVALVDIHMPGINGVQATHEIHRSSDTKVLILTSFDEDTAVHAALDAGASGFLLKSTSPEALADSIRAIWRGLSVISPGPMSRIRTPPPAQPKTPVPALGEREREVLVQLCRGFSNAEIAEVLRISESSVKGYVTTVMQKLGVTSRLRAVVRAHQLGFDRT